jgi:hypothetical protein
VGDFEYYCPACEARVAKWDFIAPPDFYRCWDCLHATPFKDLPRRSILLVGRGPIHSARIPRGIGGQVVEFPTASFTLEGVTCGKGSTLVVGADFHDDGPPHASTFSFSWNGQSSTLAVFQADGSGLSCGIAYLSAASDATADVVVTPDVFSEIACFATEITLPRVPVEDTSGSTVVPVSALSVSCSQPMSSAPQIAIGVVGHAGVPISINAPFAFGQGGNFAIKINELYAGIGAIQTVSANGNVGVNCPVTLATFGST